LFTGLATDSADRATLGTGCWLDFARWGLPARELKQGTL